MDKLLRPENLEVEPCLSDALQQWTHWIRSFENFIEAAKATEEKDRLNLLINYVSPTIYGYISDCSTYEKAIDILKIFISNQGMKYLPDTPFQRDNRLVNPLIDIFKF